MRRAVLLLSALSLVACTVEPPRAPRSWRVELSTAPTLLALTAEQVYAASFGNGVGGSQVYRVDRATGRLGAQRTLAGQPNGLVVGPTGELWLATLRLPDQPGGTGLQVVDPMTLLTRRDVQVEGVPLSLAFVGDTLWVGGATGVRQVDPATGAVLREVATAVPATRLVVVTGGLVVVGPTGLQRVEPTTGRAGPVRPVPAAGSVLAAAAGDRLWVLHPDARARTALARHDPRSLAPVVAADSPGAAGAGAALAGDVLWLADPRGGRLLCADADTGAVRDVRSVGLTGPLVADRRTVVVAQAGGAAAFPAVCTGPTSVSG